MGFHRGAAGQCDLLDFKPQLQRCTDKAINSVYMRHVMRVCILYILVLVVLLGSVAAVRLLITGRRASSSVYD